MIKTFKYPVVHFPFNKYFARLYGEKDIATLAYPKIIEVKPSDSDIEYITSLINKFVKYIVPIISGDKYLLGPFRFRICPMEWVVYEDLQSNIKDAISVIIPITSMFSSNSFNIEDPPFSRCFKTLSADPGTFIVFDGKASNHDDIVNMTGLSSFCIYFELVPQKTFPNGLDNYVPL